MKDPLGLMSVAWPLKPKRFRIKADAEFYAVGWHEACGDLAEYLTEIAAGEEPHLRVNGKIEITLVDEESE